MAEPESTAARTEAPTPKRLEDARRRGEIARSRELSSAIVGAGVFGLLVLTAGAWVSELLALMRFAFARVGARGDFIGAASAVAGEAAGTGLRVLVAPLLLAVLLAIAIGAVQTGGLLVLGHVTPDGARLRPKLHQALGIDRVGTLGKGFVLLAVVVTVIALTLRPAVSRLPALAGAHAYPVMLALGTLGKRLAFSVVLTTVVFGVGDYLWQRHRHLARLRMTREEVKRELRESEGDPHHRATRQRLHQDLLGDRSLDDVREADFVVADRNRFAIALRYHAESDRAPVVLARGAGLRAARIAEVAREAGVPIFLDDTLLRAVRDAREGDAIPEAAYRPAAEILRVLRKRRSLA